MKKQAIIFALALAWVWLGEKPTPMQIGGALVVLAGVSLARMGQDRHGAEKR